MVSAFDRIVVAVPDLPGAMAQYQQLLGVKPLACPSSGEEQIAWAALPNTVIELVQCNVDQASVRGIVLSSAFADAVEAPVANSRQLDVAIGDGSATTRFRREHPEALSCSLQVDHLVLRTADAGACIEQTVASLTQRGVDLSEIRRGRKPGTRVATIRSHCLGLPTLLIEPPA